MFARHRGRSASTGRNGAVSGADTERTGLRPRSPEVFSSAVNTRDGAGAGVAADAGGQEPVRRRSARLPFLDGIRALAALYVLMFHSLTIGLPDGGQDLSWPLRVLRGIFGYGHFAVCVFIVLSGFSIMLPIAWAGSTHFQGGYRGYFGRRARRVLPAYYAALALSLLVLIAYKVTFGNSNANSDYSGARSPRARSRRTCS